MVLQIQARWYLSFKARWLLLFVRYKIVRDCSGMQIVRSISPSISAGPMSAPYVLAPVLAIAQEVNVAEPGNEPDPTEEVPEDMTLFDATLVDRRGKQPPLSPSQH